MKLHLSTFLLFLFLSNHIVHAQIGISGSAHPSAALDVKSPGNDKVFYPPRLTTAQRNAIPNPQAGAFVYDIEKGTMYLHDGQSWLPLVVTLPALTTPINRTASDGGGYDYFGSSVFIQGDYAIVGASTHASATGAAYIFVRTGNGWSEQQKITPTDAASLDFFGFSVSLSGNYAFVGAMGKTINGNTGQGAVYVFVRSGSTWSQQQRITASDGSKGDNFGRNLAASGDYIVVGARSKIIGGNAAQGTAYVFMRSGTSWSEQQRIIASDGAVNDNFGDAVAIDGDYAVIGASGKTINGNSGQGAAYVFTRSGTSWSQQQRLVATEGSTGDNFGSSVSILNDLAVVGAPNKTIAGNSEQGAVYLFTRSGTTWNQQQLWLNGGEGAAYDNYGKSVSLSGDYIVIGAPRKVVAGNYAQGLAYLFKRNSGGYWSQFRRITDNPSTNTYNGWAVGISNGTFIIGSSFGVGKVAFGTVD
ncbi:FG-GAP repeat protein [Fibrella aquatica]|uniref:FG-GAP repeat protein n=1 Tax=Fibrella aquatica TaxID=3242487 RepID=UPI00351F9883